MGRKKIEIKFIENKKERAVTFCKRKHGLLKKAAELATLCGVKVGLVFSDLYGCLHYFGNCAEIKVDLAEGSKLKRDAVNTYNYSLDDYPFTEILEIQKREQKELLQTSADLLGKRTDWDARLTSLADFEDYKPGKKLQPTKSQIRLLKKSGSSDQDEEYSESEGAPTPPRYRQLDADQTRCIDFFMVEVDKLSQVVASKENRDPRRDEDLITLMALKQFVRNYFVGDPLSDQVCRIMKSKIKVNEMIMVLSSLKFKDKNPDMLLVTMKQFTDIFFELIVNPESFKTSQINFYRGGKSIINVFIFLIKGYFQQVRIMRSIYSDELAKNDVLHLFEEKDALDVLRVLVSASLQLAAQPSAVGISGISPNSAFQVHSCKQSQSHRQPQLQPPVDPSQEITSSSQEKLPFNQGSLLRSGQGKPLAAHQYSFEFGRDMTGSDRHSTKEENLFQFKNEDSLVNNSTGSIQNFGGIQIPIAGNINSFVTNLLKKTDNRLKPN